MKHPILKMASKENKISRVMVSNFNLAVMRGSLSPVSISEKRVVESMVAVGLLEPMKIGTNLDGDMIEYVPPMELLRSCTDYWIQIAETKRSNAGL